MVINFYKVTESSTEREWSRGLWGLARPSSPPPPPPGEPHGGRKTGGEAVGQEIPPPHALSVGHHDAGQDDEEEDETCQGDPKPTWNGKFHIHARMAVLVSSKFDKRFPCISHNLI